MTHGLSLHKTYSISYALYILLFSKPLGELKPFEFDAVAPDLCKVILCLLHKPAFFGTTENFGYSYGHFGRYAALSAYEFGKCLACHSKGGGGVCDCQARRLDAGVEKKD